MAREVTNPLAITDDERDALVAQYKAEVLQEQRERMGQSVVIETPLMSCTIMPNKRGGYNVKLAAVGICSHAANTLIKAIGDAGAIGSTREEGREDNGADEMPNEYTLRRLKWRNEMEEARRGDPVPGSD